MKPLDNKKDAYKNVLRFMPMSVLTKFTRHLYEGITMHGGNLHDQGIIFDAAMELLKEYYPEFKL